MDILRADSPGNNASEKICTKCGYSFSATPEFFHRDKHQKDGLRPYCKRCIHEHGQSYRAQPGYLEQKHVYMRDYRKRPEVRERRCISDRVYAKIRYRRPEVRERHLAYAKVHGKAYRNRPEVRKRTRERKRVYMRTYMRVHGQKYHNHPEARLRKRAYMKVYEQIRRHRPQRRESVRIKGQLRRARNKAVSGNCTPAQIVDMLKRHRYRCYFCHAILHKDAKRVFGYDFHIEHTFPISRVAGTDIPANDISYLVPSCPTCNLSKGDKFPWEWPEGGRLL